MGVVKDVLIIIHERRFFDVFCTSLWQPVARASGTYSFDALGPQFEAVEGLEGGSCTNTHTPRCQTKKWRYEGVVKWGIRKSPWVSNGFNTKWSDDLDHLGVPPF